MGTDGSVSLLTPVGGGPATDTIVNDVVRGSFSFRKVDSVDNSKYLANSTYNLYRASSDGEVAAVYADEGGITLLSAAPALLKRAARLLSGTPDLDSLTLVATAVTGADGTLTFSGLLTGVTYYLKEAKAPDGSQVSAKPVSFKLETVTGEDGKPETKVTDVDNGSGTVTQTEDGEIRWQSRRSSSASKRRTRTVPPSAARSCASRTPPATRSCPTGPARPARQSSSPAF